MKIFLLLYRIWKKIYYIGRKIKSSIINRVVFFIYNVDYGKNIRINGMISIYGRGKIILKDNIIINSHIEFNPIGGQSGVILNTYKSGNIYIDSNVGMSNVSICSMKSIKIEKNVMIGGNVKIYDTDFHSLNKKYRLSNPDPDIVSKSVLIKEGAFIGGHSIILKGVTIGKNSIIGAGSVVTKDVPDNQIWAGNPIRFIRNID